MLILIMDKKFKILVIGAGGYIGSMLIPELVNDGYEITCFDRFTVDSKLKKEVIKKVRIVKGDVRKIDSTIFNHIDVVIDLVGLTKNINMKNEQDVFEINKSAREKMIRLAKQNGIKRYIRISSGNVYGGSLIEVTEETVANPTNTYAKINLVVDNEALLLNDDNFSVTILRFASIYGFSTNMRWDQSIHSMIRDLFCKNQITVKSKLSKRPFLHIKDAIAAIILVIKSDRVKISGEIFNVGSNEHNLTMEEIVKKINQIENKCKIILLDEKDENSFSMNSKKIHELLGFKPKFDINYGIVEIINKLRTKELIINENS